MFKSPLQVEKIGENKWELLAPLVYEGTRRYIIPTGFKTDFASVPRIFWYLCPPIAGNHAEPSVLHDYLCENYDDQPHADKMFLEAMQANDVGWFKRTIMFQAVRLYQIIKGKY
jgi:hypothetical protein